MSSDRGKGVAKDDLSVENESSDMFLNENQLNNNDDSTDKTDVPSTSAVVAEPEPEPETEPETETDSDSESQVSDITEDGEQITKHPEQVEVTGDSGAEKAQKKRPSSAELHNPDEKKHKEVCKEQLQLEELMPNLVNQNMTDKTSILGPVFQHFKIQKNLADELTCIYGGENSNNYINQSEYYNQVVNTIESFLPKADPGDLNLDLDLDLHLHLGRLENKMYYNVNDELPPYPITFNEKNPYHDPLMMVQPFLDVQVQSAMINYHHELFLQPLHDLLEPFPDHLPPVVLDHDHIMMPPPPLLDLLPPFPDHDHLLPPLLPDLFMPLHDHLPPLLPDLFMPLPDHHDHLPPLLPDLFMPLPDHDDHLLPLPDHLLPPFLDLVLPFPGLFPPLPDHLPPPP